MSFGIRLLLAACLATPGFALAQEASAPDFNRQIAPLLKKYCTGCHNADDPQGKLVLERHAAILAGGGRGRAVVPGKSEQSRLVQVLNGKAKPAMPPEGNPAPKTEEIALLAAWIDAGAKGPSGAELDPTLLVTPKVKLLTTPRQPIHAVAYSPDGKQLAIAGLSQISLVTADQLKRVREFSKIRGAVNDLAFSADGAQLTAAAGEPGLFGEVQVFNVADGQPLRTIVGHRDALYAVAISPDKRIIATGSYDEQIKLWSLETGKELRTLSGHNGAIFGLAFNRSGNRLASASADRTVKLWDVASGQRLDTFGQSLKEIFAVAFSPDGTRVAGGGVDNRIRIWQISADGREGTNPLLTSRFAQEGAIVKLAYSPDGQFLLSAAEDRTVKLWDAKNLVERSLLAGQSDVPAAVAFSPDSRSFAVGRLDGTLSIFEAQSGRELASLHDEPKKPPIKPELTSVEPRGLQRGQSAKLTLTGKHLAEVSALKFNSEQLVGKLLEPRADSKLTIEVTAADATSRGVYELSVMSAGGTSAAAKLYVDDLPQLVESEPNETSPSATRVTMPAGCWGVISAQGDADYFSFDAKRGQNVVLDLSANSLGAKLNGVLTLFDAAGRVLEANNDFDGQADPLLAFTIPADGRYAVRVSDLLLSGSREHFYRLSIGTFPLVTACFPMSVPANKTSDIELAGYNLPPQAKVQVTAGAAGEIAVPIDRLAPRSERHGTSPGDMPHSPRSRREWTVLVGDLPELLEAEPNDRPPQATVVTVPCTVNGRIWQTGEQKESTPDFDLFRFETQKGKQWIIETDAARRGSPIDTRIEVVDSAGKPVERLLMQATRDSYITFRPIDSQTVDARVKNWEEMELNEWMYMQGDVCKIFRMPQGPDSGFNFYALGGKRRCYFDTSPTTHALDENCYIVEPHPPGTKLVPNGLPVFPLYYANDDDGERKLGSDSRLTFTAPANGTYLVRVSDVRGMGGDRFAYRLTIREPKPDFTVTLTGANPTINAGSGKGITFSAVRHDGFDEDIAIEITGLPPGFTVSSPIVIQAGHVDAKAVIHAAADVPAPTAENWSKTKVTATAIINGSPVVKPVNDLGKIQLAEKPNLTVYLEPAELVIAPGKSITATLRVERNGFKDRITFAVDNLPHGVIVDNIGLNGVLIPEGQSQRQIFLSASPWVPETSRPFHAVATNAGSQASRPVTLHVRKSGVLAKVME